MLRKDFALTLLLAIGLLLSACEQLPPIIPIEAEQLIPAETETEFDPGPPPEVPAETAETSPIATLESPQDPPTVVEYNLGDIKIAQSPRGAIDELPMLPLRLNGLIGLPSGSGAHPIVLIIHDRHPGCPPETGSDKDVWPCRREQEQYNYLGFEYLVNELAAQGYVALAINANAAYTSAFDEAEPGSRLGEIINLHLGKLIEAGQGGQNKFGVDVYGRIDGQRVIWIGHGAGGELAEQLISGLELDEAVGAAYAGYGPVRGLLQIAPSHEAYIKSPPVNIPLDIILPACDGQDMELRGQYYFEAAREAEEHESPVTTLLLERANHNDFNAIAIPDMAAGLAKPDCLLENLAPPDEQHAFLANYATAFVDGVVGSNQEKIDAAARKGLDPSVPVPQQLFERQVQIAISPGAEYEDLLLRPFSDSEISHNLLGGGVLSRGVKLLYCAPNNVEHEYLEEFSGCLRLYANHPGEPAQMLATWDQPGSSLFFTLPEEGLDLSNHAAFQLRAAVDPLSSLSAPGESLSLIASLTDRQGNTAEVAASEESPALNYPPGKLVFPENGGNTEFAGHVQMSTVRFPLDEFSGLNLADIGAVSLHFDPAKTGALFLADLAFVRPKHYPGSYSTLLVNDGSLDHLRGIGRFHGAASCTAALLDTGAPEAKAVVITNGHCAQQWSDEGINVDLPATEMLMVFNFFANTRAVQTPVAATRVLYSTMEGRDIALVELSATLGELQKRDIFPFPLAGEAPYSAERVTVLGAPAAELPSTETYLRQEECSVSGRASLMESDWQFDNVYRLSCQDIYGGSSGSPLFFDDSHEITAIINTTTVGGETPCDLNAPCEITATGPVFRVNTSYATPVDGIGNCFTSDGYFELRLPGCPLEDSQ